MCAMLGYNGLKVEKDPIFARDFPIWRGIAFIILYIWCLAFTFFYFDKYKINHYIVLDYEEHHRSTYSDLFNIAGAFSTIFGVMFVLYVLAISGIINFGSFQPRYFSLIIWGLFILFMINPLPTKYYRSRFFIFKRFWHFIYAPLPWVFHSFFVKWMGSQMSSFITPFQDFVYTVCYFTTINFENYIPDKNPCKKPAKDAAFIYTLVLSAYGLAHIIRWSIYNRKYFLTKEFQSTIKLALNLPILIISYVNATSKKLDDPAFPAWLTLTILSVLYSSFLDIFKDFGLLNRKANYWLLRDKIMFSPHVYYIVMVVNFILRLGFIFTLSPNMV